MGYGAANLFEGNGPTPTPSNTTAALRKDGGAQDTDDNANDFEIGTPNPRHSSSEPNQDPNCSNVSASPTMIWPPTRDQFRLVTLSGATDPDGDTLSFHIDGVSQDEPVTGGGIGDDTAPDAQLTNAGADSNQVLLRAERNPQAQNGRVYRIAYTVTDGQGGSCSRTAGEGGDTNAKVGVPRFRNQTAVDDGASNSWNSITGDELSGTLP